MVDYEETGDTIQFIYKERAVDTVGTDGKIETSDFEIGSHN